jgi:hypothetical protein
MQRQLGRPVTADLDRDGAIHRPGQCRRAVDDEMLAFEVDRFSAEQPGENRQRFIEPRSAITVRG